MGRPKGESREVDFDDEYDNPLANGRTSSGDVGSLAAGAADAAAVGSPRDPEEDKEQPGAVFDAEPVSPGDPKNVDDWGNLSLGAVRTGEVDELILNWCKNSCASNWLDALVLGCIIANTALLAAAGPATTFSEEELDMMVVADLVLTIIFTGEMIIRIVALGFWDRKGTDPTPRYLNNAWNKMDFFVVVSSWLNIVVEATGLQLGIDMNSLRALRILRVLKAFKSIEGIRVILATIAAAIPHTINVVAFLCFLFVVCGIVGVQMFRGLTRHKCVFSHLDLVGQLSADRFPMVDYTDLGPWSTANVSGKVLLVEVGAATVVNESHPGPYPSWWEPSSESMGLGVWATYCTVDTDCPLYNARDRFNRTQTCQRSLNPGRDVQSYDAASDAWISIFINMACLYWWETAHRYVDANSAHEVPSCSNHTADYTCEAAYAAAGGSQADHCPEGCEYSEASPGSLIAWTFGMVNVFLLTMVTVNMFVAAVTTIFMDMRSNATPPDEKALAIAKDNRRAVDDDKAAAWTKPFYFVEPFGGEGPYVETMRLALAETKGVMAVAEFEEDKFPGSRSTDIPRIQLQIDDKLQEIRNAGGATRTEDEEPEEVPRGIIYHPHFDRFILSFIMINTVALASEHHDREQCIPMQLAEFASYDCKTDCEPSLQLDTLCQSPAFIESMKQGNYIFNFVFTVECLLKIFGMGFKSYIKVAFNKLDFFIVVTSSLDMLGEALSTPGEDEGGGAGIFKLFRVFRLFRVLRVARILYRNANLKRVLQTVFGSGAALINLTAFIFFTILLFAILGMHLLSGNYTPVNLTPSSPYGQQGSLWGRLAGDGVYDVREAETEFGDVRYAYDVVDFIDKGLIPRRNFEDFPRAFLLAFQVMTGDDWVNQMHDYLEVRPAAITWMIFFANFSFCNFILLSLFIAVILENFQIAEAEKMKLQANQRETKIRKAEEDAKKPHIYFPHRLTWLFGGPAAGKKTGTLWSIGPDVEVYVSEPFDIDDEDNGLLVAGDKWYNDDKSCFMLEPDHPFRSAMKTLAENTIFDTIVLCAIVIGTVLLALEGPPGTLPAQTLFLFGLVNDFLFCIFLLEFVSKVVAYGFMFPPKSYLKNMWNRLDFIVVTGSIANYLGANAGFVRLLRCLRPLRIINSNKGMKVIISAAIESLDVNVGVLALSGLGLLMFAILGVSLFGGVMWSCTCTYVYPSGVTPATAVFGDDGGWLDLTTGLYDTSTPEPVLTENHCVGNDQLGGLYGVDPSLPDTISECYWVNRPYNFDTIGNAMMALFTASTLAGWTDIMEAAIDQTGIGLQPASFSQPGFLVYFLMYVLIMAFFVTNLFIGVLIDFISTSDGSALLTDDQQKMTDTMKYAKIHRPQLADSAPDMLIRKWSWNLVESTCWNLTSNCFIVFNVAVMMCEYEDQSVAWWSWLELLNMICLVFFTIEMFLKILAYLPQKYWEDGWSKFDCIVISLSWAGIIFEMGGAQAIRAMRALRIVVVLKSAKGIRSLFQTLMLSMAPGINITILLLLLYSVYAIMGMMLFGNTPVQDVECAAEPDLDKLGQYLDPSHAAYEYCKVGMKLETCEQSINPFFVFNIGEEFISPDVNCTEGYIRGTSSERSTTCKAGCTLTEATYVNRETWFSPFSKGKPGHFLMGLNRQYTHHASFHSFGSAIKLLCQCATGQDWKFVMYAVGGEPGHADAPTSLAFVYFMSFFFLSNYILFNLFVAVILDNFQSSMREGELDVGEEDFIDFKFKFRSKTTDAQPEVLLFRDLWALLVDIGGDETPNDDGEVLNTNSLTPPKETYWSKDNEMAWALSCDSGETPSDLKAFLKRVYVATSSPFKLDGQPGISFKEYYSTLMETPMLFESADQWQVCACAQLALLCSACFTTFLLSLQRTDPAADWCGKCIPGRTRAARSVGSLPPGKS